MSATTACGRRASAASNLARRTPAAARGRHVELAGELQHDDAVASGALGDRIRGRWPYAAGVDAGILAVQPLLHVAGGIVSSPPGRG
jgi:hypothetical protein